MGGLEPAAGTPGDADGYRVDFASGPVADGEDLLFGPLTFYRRRNPDGLIPVVSDPGDGGGAAVGLAVRQGAYLGPLDHPADAANDRCELRGPKQPLGTDAWQGFSIRVPEGFPVVPLRCVVAQMKMPFDASGDGSPVFALRIDEGRWLATVEHLYEPDDKKAGRDLSSPCGDRCVEGAPAFDHSNFNQHDGPTDFQVRALLATQADAPGSSISREFTACTTGVRVRSVAPLPNLVIGGGWTDFVVRIRSSGVKDVDGVVELYVDRRLIATAAGEFGYPSTEWEPVQYFKVGPYRNNDAGWGSGPARVEYRNVRAGAKPGDVDLSAATDAPTASAAPTTSEAPG